MKTLCLVMDTHDAVWLPEFISSHEGTNYTIAALTCEGQLLANSMGVSFDSFEKLAWDLNIQKNFDAARDRANSWQRLASVAANPDIIAAGTFSGYPLFRMHQSKIQLAFFEIISAFELITRIIAQEKPTRLMFGERPNPFTREPLHMITGSGGLEREAAKTLAGLVDLSDSALNERLELIQISTSSICENLPLHSKAQVEPPEPDKKRVLFFHYGGYYYLDYVEQTIAELIRCGLDVVVVNVGSALTESELAFFSYFDVCFLEKSNWQVPDESLLRLKWRDTAFAAARAVYNNTELHDYFSLGKNSYHYGLAADAICREIFKCEQTIIELMRCENILAELRPDVVVNHFAFHPEETCYVLPVRKAGIPCITMEHGFNWCGCAIPNTFATDIFAVNGDLFRDALKKTLGARRDEVIAVGSLRRNPEPDEPSLSRLVQSLGLDPGKPLVIFCDNSVFPYYNEYRHKTLKVVEEVLALLDTLPGLQIIYRVHHGGNYQALHSYFEQFRCRGLLFQNSLDIPLVKIATAADLVISGASSAISEALLCGVPVVYLTALAVEDPAFADCGAIHVANSYSDLPITVENILSSDYTRKEVLAMAQPFFDATMTGNDGEGHLRFSALISKMAHTPSGQFETGFNRWISRIEAAATFNSENATTREKIPAMSYPPPPFVSVIMPAYNRAHMIGITLESFINQDYPKDRFEIIVSDNNSTDATKAVVLDWQRKSPVPITYIFEGRQGVHYARNTAAKQSRGDILYYTDDDMIAEPNLLSEIVKVFDLDPLVGTATGRVLPKWEIPPPEWILQLCYNGYLSIFDELGDGILIEENDPGVYSCHQAIRREVFFKSGGYNPESTYTDYIGDGETGLNNKIRALGYKFGYNGKSVIRHMIPPGRMTQDYLNKRLANQGSADSYTEYKRNCYSRDELAQRIREYQQSLLERTAQAVLGRLHGGEQWRMDKAYTHYYLNRIEYDIRLMEDAGWRELVLKDNWIDE